MWKRSSRCRKARRPAAPGGATLSPVSPMPRFRVHYRDQPVWQCETCRTLHWHRALFHLLGRFHPAVTLVALRIEAGFGNRRWVRESSMGSGIVDGFGNRRWVRGDFAHLLRSSPLPTAAASDLTSRGDLRQRQDATLRVGTVHGGLFRRRLQTAQRYRAPRAPANAVGKFPTS